MTGLGSRHEPSVSRQSGMAETPHLRLGQSRLDAVSECGPEVAGAGRRANVRSLLEGGSR